MELPKYNASANTNDRGITIVKELVEELGWRFRINHQEDDFGIDGFIDVINADRQVTGKFINVQVKSGESYFREQTSKGWVYRGEEKHLNYYLNHDNPVILLLVNLDNRKVYWVKCEGSKMELRGKFWKIVVPYRQMLNKSAHSELEKLVSPVVDYASQIREFSQRIDYIVQIDVIVFNVKKSVILNQQVQYLIDAFEEMSENEKLLVHLKGKIEIAIDDYNEDERELFAIEETRQWVKRFTEKVKGWSYFLQRSSTMSFLKLMQFCDADFQTTTEMGIPYSNEELNRFLSKAYVDLNDLCDKYGIPMDVNKEISSELEKFVILNAGEPIE